ncbi:hypothetical protein Misp01_35640 [Microtetraspora sp. NBRC 13810]|uniref:hypothetical protein n=1 Tax=Microtetraspora sp. NBRC 13810 TaxID=3030990 RepID=UPI0024A486BD|nr:hypothetical protein [Microtetraspora sp. NBRC 13810]GLW08434.1 hypothetical protein Misp01_35640 [Microtetraspora sp. NBRC 13810]
MRLPVWRCLMASAVLTLSTACTQSTSGPTATQAGETLKTHITQLMAETDLRDVKVVDAGGKDVACGEGGTKRTYAVQVQMPYERPSLIGQMAGALSRIWGYEVTEVFGGSEKTILRLESARTNLTLDMPDVRLATVAGETDCVPAPD